MKPSHNIALHSLFVNLFLTSKISLVLSLKQYRPYVLNLAFGLEVISACRRGSPTDKIFAEKMTIPHMAIARTQDGVLFSKLLRTRRQKNSQTDNSVTFF